jgi:hypothetical protein
MERYSMFAGGESYMYSINIIGKLINGFNSVSGNIPTGYFRKRY